MVETMSIRLCSARMASTLQQPRHDRVRRAEYSLRAIALRQRA
jgi:hypothetical protein